MKPLAAFLSSILLLACLACPGPALESKVNTVSEKTLSVDLGPSFEINRSALNISDNGMASQDFLINNTASAGSAFISIMSVYDEVLGKMSPSSLSEIFLIGQYPGKFELIHVKDEIAVNTTEKYESAILGKGILPVKEVLDICRKTGGTKVFIIEQESYQDKTPLACVQEDLAIMKKWGY